MYANDYIIASNNCINDNRFNAQKLAAKTPAHKLKSMLKPLLRMLRNKSAGKSATIKQSDDDYAAEYDNNRNFSIESSQHTFASSDACYDDDNSANEELESRIFNEIHQCSDEAGVYVYNSNDEYELQSVERDQKYVPVHFARTEAGTFFWTTVQRSCDADLAQPMYCQSAFQQPELQFGDRWVQA